MKSLGKRPLILGLAVAALLLLGLVVWVISGGPEPSATRDKALADIQNNAFDLATVDDSLLADLLTYRLQPGKSYWYQFSRKVEATLQDKPVVSIELSGLLAAHVVEEKAGVLSTIISVEFQNLRGIDSTALAREGKGKTAHTALFAFDRSGLVQALRFTVGAEEAETEIIKDLLSNWLQSLPTKTAAEGRDTRSSAVGRLLGQDRRGPFAVRGVDTHGEYQSRLFVLPGEGVALRLEAAKQNYLSPATPVSVQGGETRGDFDLQKGYHLSRSGNDELEIGPAGFRVKSSQSYSFTFQKIADSAFGPADLAAYVLPAKVYDPDLYRAAAADIKEARVRSWSEVKELLSELKPDTDGRKKHDAFHQLTKTLRSDASAVNAALAEVRRYPPETDQFQMIIGALSYAGSPEAQSGLIALFQGQALNQRGLQNILFAFAMMDEKATPEAKGFLSDTFARAESPEIENSAGLAMASTQRANPDDRTRRLIEQEWSKARTPSRKRFVLEMVGNSGDDSYLPIVREAFRSNNPFLQTAALKALRFMQSKEAVQMILSELSGNQNEQLATAAAEALAHHTWDAAYARPVTECVQRRKSTNLRIACANYALGEPSQQAAMRQVLSAQKGTGAEDFDAYIEQQLAE